ncbi:MAG: hypothetical protein EPO13_06600 [Actinomycetota bacterium]|nr:MAG: hypothetical protein EPO13_06600 [Actinomycetota bacterium]
MRRLFWVAVGAAGGIYAYRRATTAMHHAKDRGLAGNISVAADAAGAWTTRAHRGLRRLESWRTPADAPRGTAPVVVARTSQPGRQREEV